MLSLMRLPFLLLYCTCLLISDTLAASNSTKAGLAWPNGNWNIINQYTTTGKVAWYYTWSPSPISTSLEFVPMLWGDRQVSEWETSINRTIKNSGATHVLGFNEPDYATQSNMTPSHAASVWQAQIEPLRSQGVLLGSPAPTSAPEGKQWLLDWLDACNGGCTVDFVALHWYDINSTAFITYLEDFHNTFQRPLWITEWACQNFNAADEQCSLQNVVDFLNATQSFMDSTAWVERYAWFGAMESLQGVNQDDALMDSSGRINTLGEQYIGAVTPNTSSNYTPGVVDGGYGSSTSPSLGSAALPRRCLPRILATLLLSSAVTVLSVLS
ncbi:glycosyl hydrolase catalytic core-domain-containing protein [Fomitopsis serialis]|uniref:glycosyl hydrolase catalytic core-domain-containing protein n=1 Tax=Fomitopsis serialis TaxID=139415 RepID=UPI0020077CEC|nr:glycosyl hydrolase catalytic core-domain-containing protein [Neoantrodia serialis]KAH9938450.1 glycosyl hydrolase catalytic core-domain-containing protein [Neoantrodia serialis]